MQGMMQWAQQCSARKMPVDALDWSAPSVMFLGLIFLAVDGHMVSDQKNQIARFSHLSAHS